MSVKKKVSFKKVFAKKVLAKKKKFIGRPGRKPTAIVVRKKKVVFKANQKSQCRSLITLDQLKCIKYDFNGDIHSKSQSFLNLILIP